MDESNQHAIWLAEFSLLVGTGKDYFSMFLKAFGFYLAATGATLKFFFDAPQASQERIALLAFGASLHVAAIVGTLLGGRWYRPMAARCKEVGRLLGLPDVYYPGTTGTAYVFLIIEVLLLAAWVGGLWKFR
ncbi:MAG TPA: hypothetical protein VJH03_04625 [Blastocatellia bacterium]|nr:hypothetical protein [Blastocatellia bacterium]